MVSVLCAFMAVVFQRLMFRVSRLRQDYRKITGRRPEEHCVSGPVLLETMERFREASAKPPRSLREAPAKPPRSHRRPTSMLRPFEAQPCPVVLKLNASLAAFHRPLSHGLNLIQQHGGACLWNKHPRSPAKPLREATVLPRSLAKPTLPQILAPRSPPRSLPSSV